MPQNIPLFVLSLTLAGLLVVEYRRLTEGNGVIDSVTGLPTEDFFLSYLIRCVARARRMPGYDFAVISVQLQRSKEAQVRSARRFGKAMLVDAAHRMRESLRTSDVITHVKGETFLVLLENIDGAADVRTVLQRIREAVSEVTMQGGQRAFTAARFGVAMGAEGTTEPETLIEEARTALRDRPNVALVAGRRGYAEAY